MISVVVHDEDSIRIRIPELTHDIEGRVVEGEASVNYTIYVDSTDEIVEQGSMGYTPQMGWSVITQLPASDVTQRMRAEVVAVAFGAQRTFEELFTVRAH